MSGPTNHTPTHFWKQQSPINLSKDDSIFVKFPKSYFKAHYNDAPFAGVFEGADGHKNFVLTKPHTGKNPPTIVVGDAQAELIKIHLHTPSEHDLDSHDLGGEIHLIHRITKPVGGSELFVLGVFFNQVTKGKKSTSKSEDKSKASIHSEFFSMWSTAVGDSKQKKESVSEIQNIDPRNLLPDTGRWFRYEGSLTTEPYSEIVSWLVFEEPLEILSKDFEELKKNAHQPERSVQPINRRFVLRNFA